MEQHPNVRLINMLYTAIQNADAKAIAACYADDAHFEDIAFRLHGKEHISDMWRMVCHSRPQVTFDSVKADDRKGSGRWRAIYRFGKTDSKPGRPVDNTLTSDFTFRDGLIVEHRDKCDARVWARQAYAFPASIFASIGPIRRYMAARKLANFIKSQA